jgi:hypothetical protein
MQFKQVWQNGELFIIIPDELVSRLATLLGIEGKHYFFYNRSSKEWANFILNHRN